MKQISANRALLILVASQLGELLEQLAFVGGCTTELFITDGVSRAPRPTRDVDAIVHISTFLQYQTLSQALRDKGFSEDATMGAPLCRWRFQDAMLDVMPTDEAILGFTNRWYVPALETCQPYQLTDYIEIRLVRAPYFIATKLEAFFSRGNGDYLMSHDLEDIIMVLDGRPELMDEISAASTELKSSLAMSFRRLLADQDFVDSISAHLAPDSASQARRRLILERLERVTRL